MLKLQRAERTPGHSRAEEAQIHMMLGLCHVQTYDEGAAAARFEAALVADPAAKLPEFAPPSATELFANVAQRLAQERASSAGAANGSAAGGDTQANGATSTAPAGPALGLPAVASFGMFGLGALALGGSVVSFLGASSATAIARDPESFQDSAIENAKLANFELALGTGLLAISAASITAGIALLTGYAEDPPPTAPTTPAPAAPAAPAAPGAPAAPDATDAPVAPAPAPEPLEPAAAAAPPP